MSMIDKPLAWFKKYDNNPRHNNSAIAAVRESIKEFGPMQPIVAEKDGTIIVGHTRYAAALQLGLKTFPVIIADKLTPTQIKAYRLVDNKVGELAQWDQDKLTMEIAELMQVDFDLSKMGFTPADLNMIEEGAKQDARWLEDFHVLPAPKPQWILIKAQEDVAAELVATLRQQYKDSKGVVIHYSGEAAP